MKYLTITTLMLATCLTAACADHNSNKKSGWLFGVVPPLEWPERHWEYSAQSSHIRNHDEILPSALDRDRSMFNAQSMQGLKPEEFIANLQDADIIDGIYNYRENIFKKPTDDIVIELDYNFYTLSRADQVIITELLAQSYNNEVFMLKDAHTHDIVGEITPDGFVLF